MNKVKNDLFKEYKRVNDIADSLMRDYENMCDANHPHYSSLASVRVARHDDAIRAYTYASELWGIYNKME